VEGEEKERRKKNRRRPAALGRTLSDKQRQPTEFGCSCGREHLIPATSSSSRDEPRSSNGALAKGASSASGEDQRRTESERQGRKEREQKHMLQSHATNVSVCFCGQIYQFLEEEGYADSLANLQAERYKEKRIVLHEEEMRMEKLILWSTLCYSRIANGALFSVLYL
jgi:hypothetical protein